MIEDDSEIAELRTIVSNMYLANIESHYGESAVDAAEGLTDCLTIWNYSKPNLHQKVHVDIWLYLMGEEARLI